IPFISKIFISIIVLAVCGFPPYENGHCYALIPSYSYIESINKCSPWTYYGCGNAINIFISKEDCEEKCVE
ncbi:hypothetical protein KR200_004226, partial [Drosophila serrata]